jgi:hypothetical protein
MFVVLGLLDGVTEAAGVVRLAMTLGRAAKLGLRALARRGVKQAASDTLEEGGAAVGAGGADASAGGSVAADDGASVGPGAAHADDPAFSASDLEAYEYATSDAKLAHIFVPKHNLGPLVQQFGSREGVIARLLNGISALTPASGVFQVSTQLGGQTVIVRGAVVNDVIKIGTAFTP